MFDQSEDRKNKQEDIDPMPEVNKILSEELEIDNYVALKKQIAVAEAWQSRVSVMHRNEARFLAAVRRQYLPAKLDRSITEMDREITLDSRTSDQTCIVNILKDYSSQLERRVSLGQSLLSSMKAEMKTGLR